MGVGSAATPSNEANVAASLFRPDSEELQGTQELFVGREREMQALRSKLEEGIDGNGSLLLVSGEPGIGKTRLLTEAARYAERGNARVLWGRCWEGEGAPAFWPWVQVLRNFTAEECASDPNHEALQYVLGRQKIGSFVGGVNVSPEAQFQLFDATSTVLRSVSLLQPLVILLDDLHEADQSSIRFLEFLSTEVRHSPMTILGSVRSWGCSEQQATWLHSLRRDIHVQTLELVGLDDRALKEFLVSHLSQAQVLIAQSDIERIARRTEGNPFFLHEICEAIRKAGKVDLPPVLDVPESIQALLRKRLADLPAECATLLQCASVIGRTFSTGLLQELCPEDPTARRTLHLAEGKGLVRPSRRNGDELHFSHALVREALYSRIPHEIRSQLHNRVGELLEAQATRTGQDFDDALALHYFHGRPHARAGKALHYTLRAARRAKLRAAYDHQVDLLSRALAITEQGDPLRIDILLELGHALSWTGRWSESRDVFLEAAELARFSNAAAKLGEAAIGAKGLILAPAPPDQQSIDLLTEALSGLPREETLLRIRLLHALSTATHFCPPRNAQDKLASEALRLAKSTSSLTSMATALEAMIVSNWRPGRAGELLRYACDLLDIGREIRDEDMMARAYVHIYLASSRSLDTAASRQLDLAEQTANQANHPKLRWQVSLLRSSQALARGNLTAGLDHARAAGELGKKCHDQTAFLHLGLNLLLRARLCGEFIEFETPIREGAKLTPDIPLSKLTIDCADFAANPTTLSTRVLSETYDVCRDYLESNAFSLWAQCLFAELAYFTQNETVARNVGRLLGAYSDEAVVAGWGTAIEGTAKHFLGLTLLATGMHEDGVQCLRYSVRANGECGWRLLAARSQLFLATAISMKERTNLADEAIGLATGATTTFAECGIRIQENPFLMGAPGSEHFDCLQALTDPREPVSRRIRESSSVTANEAGELVCFSYQQATATMKKTKAVTQLLWLIQNPGQEVAAKALAKIDQPPLQSSSQSRASPSRMSRSPIIDDQARREYKRRVDEILVMLDDPSNDPADQVAVKQELDWLNDVLAKSTGLGSRSRLFRDQDERDRISVRNNLSNAIKRIRRQSKLLGTHLSNSVHTGSYCCYRPERA